jgi:hypothetical protein
VVAGTAAVIVVVAMPSSSRKVDLTGFIPTGSSPSQDAEQITTAFLKAWRVGNFGEAARYTNHSSAADAALVAYQKYLDLRKLTATAQNVTTVSASTAQDATTTSASTPRESVTYAISATVAAPYAGTTVSGTWSYHASLTAYQQRNSQAWYIAWTPDVLAPNLTASTHLAAVAAAPQVESVTDANGNDLTSYQDAGLTTIAGLLTQTPPAGKGTPGLDVEIQTAKGKLVPNSQAVVVTPGNIQSVATTINPQAESAARDAVGMHKDSSMVAIQPSTGDILAIANNDGYNDFALTAQVAPGSTMKIITSTALFTNGITTANSDVACPPKETVQGVVYHNDNGMSEPASTPLSYDFAQSCNNAFDQWWPDLYGKLASTAKKYYGLNQKWNIGLGTGDEAQYFTAPPSASGSELAQEAFGEGQLLASPIAMASVAATVDAGVFRQPILVPGTEQITATPLPASTDSQLKEMMRDVVTEGTADAIGFGPDVYAKTGTADIDNQGQPNSWFVAFDPDQDVAVACLDIDAGYGAQYAGPEVKDFLDQY